MQHSELGASSMERWSVCAGSVKLSTGLPSISSEKAEEGTFCHDMAEKFQRGDLPAQTFQNLTEEMQHAIKLYSQTIFDDQFGKQWPIADNGTVLHIEHKFDLSSVYPGCFGTADAVLWNPHTRILRVYDLKYGKGHFVEIVDNLQLQYYALGALVTLGYPALHVEMVIVQPRCTKKGVNQGAVRRWRVSAMQFLDFEAFLVEKAEATQVANPPLVTGRHCFWCKAHKSCPAKVAERLSKAMDSFDEVSDDDDDDPFS